MLIRFSSSDWPDLSHKKDPRELPRGGRWDGEKSSEDRYLQTLPKAPIPSKGQEIWTDF